MSHVVTPWLRKKREIDEDIQTERKKRGERGEEEMRDRERGREKGKRGVSKREEEMDAR